MIIAVKGVGESQKVNGRMNKTFIHSFSQSVSDLSSNALSFKGSRRGAGPFLSLQWAKRGDILDKVITGLTFGNNHPPTHIYIYGQFKFQRKLKQLNSKIYLS